MALTVKELGLGGQSVAELELGWDRGTIRKGIRELNSGIVCVDNYSARGRKRAEEHLPHLLSDIQALVDQQSQTDPSFKSTRLYTRLSAQQVRSELISHKGYNSDELPTVETIRLKLNQLGYHPSRVAKTQPPKKIPVPDAIFEQIAVVNHQADADPTILRLSLDAKAVVKIGNFDRGGKNRVATNAKDHDFTPTAKVTPYGIFLPQFDELFFYFTESKVTSEINR